MFLSFSYVPSLPPCGSRVQNRSTSNLLARADFNGDSATAIFACHKRHIIDQDNAVVIFHTFVHPQMYLWCYIIYTILVRRINHQNQIKHSITCNCVGFVTDLVKLTSKLTDRRLLNSCQATWSLKTFHVWHLPRALQSTPLGIIKGINIIQ